MNKGGKERKKTKSGEKYTKKKERKKGRIDEFVRFHEFMDDRR